MKFNELSHMMQKPEPKPDTYEAGMALNQLLKIGTHAVKLHNMIDDDSEMEAWVAKKIDLASNYVKSVHGYTAGSKAGTYDDNGMSEAESDYLYHNGKEIDQGSIVYDMQDYSDGIFELQSAKYADGTELDEKELEELESTQELIDWVMIDFVSESESYQPMPEGDEFDIAEDEDFEEVLGPLGFPEDETELFDAEYQGRKVPLNKPMRGDVKKFKVYVKDPKTGNVKKVNFGHGGTSAKRPTMRIRKSNPKARKSFRARHNCANPGPKTKARYWSCRKW
jgi:hypothetical protein